MGTLRREDGGVRCVASPEAIARVLAVRDGVVNYLCGKWGHYDFSWHPLFTATRELFVNVLRGDVQL